MPVRPTFLQGVKATEFLVLLKVERRRNGGPLSEVEERCWQTAIMNPHGLLVIGRQGSPYLVRCFLTPKLPSRGIGNLPVTGIPEVYLHYFLRGDADANPHNHPWKNATSHILAGGYTEYRYEPNSRWHTLGLDEGWHSEEFRPGSWNRLARDTYHRVELLEPNKGCWTLFSSDTRIEEPNGTDWGFFDIDNATHVNWRDYGNDEEE